MSSSRRSFISKAAITAAMAPLASLSKTYGQGLSSAVEKTSKYSAPSDLKITDVKCAYSGGGLFVK
ncbi:MAG TPA: twin-arginine translocation signal domain-containing protein, partial [Flavisolibacter sp.]|nr:twin-arginine translocation signal domain-containing protein [Flavisolibacter sp.]